MRKILTIVILVLFSFLMISCQSNSSKQENSKINSNSSSIKEEKNEVHENKNSNEEITKSYNLSGAQDNLILAIKKGDKFYELLNQDNYILPVGGQENVQIMKKEDQKFPKLESGDQLVIFKDDENVNLAKVVFEFYTYPLIFSPYIQYTDMYHTTAYIEDEYSSLSKISSLDNQGFSPGELGSIESINGENPVTFMETQKLAYIASTTENLIVCDDPNQTISVEEFEETKLVSCSFESKFKVYAEAIHYIGNLRDEDYLYKSWAEDKDPFFSIPVEKTKEGYFLVNTDSLENGLYIVRDYKNSSSVFPITQMFEISK